MKPKAQAVQLAERIRTYWKIRGASPTVEVVFETSSWPGGDAGDRRDGTWVIRSNMQGGMPIGFDPRRVHLPFLKD